MSGIHYTVREALMYQMGKLFGAWAFNEIVFGEPRATSANSIERLIDATYRGVTRTLKYKKQNISTITGTRAIPKTLPIGSMVPSNVELCLALNKRFGLKLEPVDIDMSKTSIKDGYITITISEQSHYYMGYMRFMVSEPQNDDIDRDTSADKRWPLAGSGEPSVGTEPLTGDFDYVTIDNVQWATTDAATPLGVALPVKGDFTLEFLLYLVAAPLSEMPLFDDIKIRLSDVGKPYIYVPGIAGYSNFNGATGIVLPLNKETKLTLRGINSSTVEVYIDGVLSCTVLDTSGMGSYVTKLGAMGNVRIRDIAYYNVPLDIPPTQAGTVNDIKALTTWGLNPWYDDNIKSLTIDPTLIKYNHSLKTYNLDYTPLAATLKTLPVHPRPLDPAATPPWTQDATSLSWLTNNLWKIDGIAWRNSPWRLHFNLNNAAIVYNGPVKDCGQEVLGVFKHGLGQNEFLPGWLAERISVPNPEFDNVLALWLHVPYNATGYSAILLIHYNEV